MKQRAPKRTRRSPRPWVVPPALLVSDEPFEGYHILDELRDELGVLLWQSARDVDLWASAPPETRPELFTPGSLRARAERISADVPADSPARPLLETLAQVLGGVVRGGAAEVAELCGELSGWAGERGLPRTALAWAQRAAVAAPEEAGPAYAVGVVARRAADYRRAETWFRRSLALARRNRDWKYYGFAHMGIANMYMQRGDAPRARARLLKALRAARRYGVWTVKPLALHDLFCISATGDDVELAVTYARAAFRSYGRRHPRLPGLAHDVARFWLTHGHFERALSIFRAVLPHLQRPQERLLAWSNIAEAAGGAGQAATMERAWSEVWRIIEEREDRERAAEALINVARGAAHLGEATRQEIAASYALTIAIRRKESQERILAERLVESARHGRRRSRSHPPADPMPVELPGSRWVDTLTAEFVEALTEPGDR
jgi:tetratricopeptide (TPR) repeat protein